MSTIEVKVPDIGDFTDVPVIEIFVKPGDTVKAEDSLVTLESDKATMDVPSPVAGVVQELKVKLGDKVAEGTPIVVLDSATPRRPRRARRPAAAPPPAAALTPAAAPAPSGTGCRGGTRLRRLSLPPRQRRPSTARHSRPRTRRRRCASSRASSASISRA